MPLSASGVVMYVLLSVYVRHNSSINSDNFERNCCMNLNSAK